MSLDDTNEKKVYRKLRAFDGIEVAGHEAVSASIASVLSEGEVLADNGEQYSSIQTAVEKSDSWVFIGPGTFYENIVIEKDDFMLQGAGNNTLIEGGTAGTGIEIKSSNVKLSKLKVNATDPEGCIVLTNGSNCRIDSVTVQGGVFGIRVQTRKNVVTNVKVNNPRIGISMEESSNIVSNCTINSTVDLEGIRCTDPNSHDCVISNSVVLDAGRSGIQLDDTPKSADSIVIGCRVINSADHGIAVGADDSIIANNRISGSTNSDINNFGTGVVVEGNLTGASN